MTLAVGTRLGPYEIVTPLGAGGMGEVYRAQDTRLNRFVAIKVLPSHLSTNSEVRARFEREARAVSSLNHPHICTLHDVGRENGIDFLVMEYVEGETLATRLEAGPIPLDELLRMAVEIADALDKAHRQGLVHRDLKPGNIMMAKSGAKLLDFGLARTTGSHSVDTDATQSPTVSQPLTAEGTIVGTFQYMAPEQLEGSEADARTDLFAFGAVLYEMATGKRAFEGRSQASLIASILKEEPRPIAELQPMTPPALERVVKRCLAKDPDDRWQTARDLSIELQWIKDAGSQAGVPARVRVKRKNRERAAWALVVALVAAVGTLGVPRLFETSTPPEVLRFTILPPDQATIAPSQAEVQVSPDGRSVVFVATDTDGKRQLWLHRLDSRAARPLPGTEDSMLPFWSPDGRSVGFFTGSGKMARISIPDGNPQILCDAPSGRGGAWSRDDVIVFAASSGGPLYGVSASGGVVTQVTALDSTRQEEAHRFPVFLPDARHFLYVSLPVRDGLFDTYVGSLDSKEPRHVISADGAVVFAEPGYIVFARDQALVAQRLDTKRFEVMGAPQLTGEVPGAGGSWTGAPRASVSTNGVIVHTGDFRLTELVWFDRQGKRQERVTLGEGLYNNQSISRDGKRVVVARWNSGTSGQGSDLWTVELARGVATRFTFSASDNYGPIWSPDGRRIVFTSSRSGNENLYVKNADASGDETALLGTGRLFVQPHDWSPDGGYVVYHALEKKTGFDLWLCQVDGDGQPVPFLVTPYNETDAQISPDGRWIAYRSDESGQWDLYVQSFPGGGNKYRVSTGGCGSYGSGFLVAWSHGGRELVYAGGDGVSVMTAAVETHPVFQVGAPRPLFKAPANVVQLVLAPGGDRFLAAVAPEGRAQSELSVVLNWTAALGSE
jgi:serine/threonine protein kinase